MVGHAGHGAQRQLLHCQQRAGPAAAGAGPRQEEAGGGGGQAQVEEEAVAKFITSSNPVRKKGTNYKNKKLLNQIVPSLDNDESLYKRIRTVDAVNNSKVDELKFLDINTLSDESLLELIEKRKILNKINENKDITTREKGISQLDSRSVIFPTKINYGHANNVESTSQIHIYADSSQDNYVQESKFWEYLEVGKIRSIKTT